MQCCHAHSSRQLACELIKALPSLKGFDLLKYEDINQVLADVVHKGIYASRKGRESGAAHSVFFILYFSQLNHCSFGFYN